MKSASALALIVLNLMFAAPGPAAAGPGQGPSGDMELRQAADRVDAALQELASSTESLASEWVKARRAVARFGRPELVSSQRSFRVAEGITLFQTWSGGIDEVPAQQSDNVSYYAYEDINDVGVNNVALRHLAEFDQLAEAFRTANHTLDLSWTYLTTADDWMLLYPFLGPDEAVNNRKPSQQVYYTQADFKTRSVGWTRPYLDLVGAGMMVTAACPAYDGNELLGVASQDITLRQLSSDVLKDLAGDGSVVVLVDEEGLAISASDGDLESEIERVNSDTGTARLYYLEPARLASVAQASAVASAEDWLNQAVTAVLDAGPRELGSGNRYVTVAGQAVLAARVKGIDWWLIQVRH